MNRTQLFLEELFEMALAHVESMTALTWRGGRDGKGKEATYMLTVYECLTELVGGKHDGAEVFSGYTVYLNALLEELGPDSTIEFCCDMGITQGNPTVTVSGEFKKKSVMIDFLSQPLPDEKPTMQHFQDGSFGPKEDEPQ